MMNSGPRRFKYHAGLNHTGDDDCLGHCQSRWHFRCHRVMIFIVGQKRNGFDHDLSLSNQQVLTKPNQGFQQCLWQSYWSRDTCLNL